MPDLIRLGGHFFCRPTTPPSPHFFLLDSSTLLLASFHFALSFCAQLHTRFIPPLTCLPTSSHFFHALDALLPLCPYASYFLSALPCICPVCFWERGSHSSHSIGEAMERITKSTVRLGKCLSHRALVLFLQHLILTIGWYEVWKLT